MPGESEVLSALKTVIDPDLGRDVVSLGFIKDLKIEGKRVSFSMELTTPACPMKEVMRQAADAAVRALPGVSDVEIKMTSRVRHAAPTTVDLPEVANIIAVASGKGGVGKSTVSANLAVSLAGQGARVGLMDADVYGPSVPLLMGAGEPPREGDGGIIPATCHGVKVVSMAYFMDEDEAVIWRGPMLHRVVGQFLTEVKWGALDYLIVDLPPGTGDIQLSLCQLVKVTGAVIVSTPQDAALKVARKAVAMFGRLETPILGLVENMGGYVCPKCGHEDDIFGKGGAEKSAGELGIPFLGRVPLSPAVCDSSDAGTPIAALAPDSPAGRAFREIAGGMAARVSVLASAKGSK